MRDKRPFEPTAETILRYIRHEICLFEKAIEDHSKWGVGPNLEHIVKVHVLRDLLRELETYDHPELDPRSAARKSWDAFLASMNAIFGAQSGRTGA